MSLQDISNLALGRNDQVVELQTSEEHRAATLALITQTQRSITIFTRDLDAKIFGDAEIVDAIKDLVLSSRQSKVRIITQSISRIVSRGHRLVDLYRRVPSYMDIRFPAKEHRAYNCAFLVSDRTGVIFQIHADRYEGTANFSDKTNAENLSNQFEEMWEVAHRPPDLRALSV